MDELSEHWQEVHRSKFEDVSWWQNSEDIWLDLFLDLNLASTAEIIDVGAGASLLIDSLSGEGFANLSALDISDSAIERLRVRTGEISPPVHFYVGNVLNFEANQLFDVWHDRAVFHFLTTESEQTQYLESLLKNLRPDGLFILATFALYGPDQCSGLPVARHNLASLVSVFGGHFEVVDSGSRIHRTPWGSIQPFTIARFRRRSAN